MVIVRTGPAAADDGESNFGCGYIRARAVGVN
jgi:hypothetical protein